MSPEQDSESRENGDFGDRAEDSAGEGPEEDSGAGAHPADKSVERPAGKPRNSKANGRYSATELGKRARSLGSLGMIPILLAVGPIIGLFIGQWLDKQFNSSPWLTALFVVLGFVAVVREMIQLLKRYSDEDQENKSDKDS